MDERTLRARLTSWENLGPLRTLEEMRGEMDRGARASGPSAAPLLSGLLSALEREKSGLLDPMLDFLDAYVALFPEVLAAALLAELGPSGPPTLIEVLGSTRFTGAVEVLRERVNLDAADADVLVAVACALGEIGGADAIDMLRELQRRPALPERARREVEIALERQGFSP